MTSKKCCSSGRQNDVTGRQEGGSSDSGPQGEHQPTPLFTIQPSLVSLNLASTSLAPCTTQASIYRTSLGAPGSRLCAIPSFTFSNLAQLTRLGVIIKTEKDLVNVVPPGTPKPDENQNSKPQNFVQPVKADVKTMERSTENSPTESSNVTGTDKSNQGGMNGNNHIYPTMEFPGSGLIALVAAAEQMRQQEEQEGNSKQVAEVKEGLKGDGDVAGDGVDCKSDHVEMEGNKKSEANDDDSRETFGCEVYPHHRIRSLISGEHKQILRELYQRNTRPSKADFERLAKKMPFPKRVIQVWFQNMRARDRRKARVMASKGIVEVSRVVAEDETALMQQPEVQPSPCSDSEELMQCEPLDLSTKSVVLPEEALNLSTRDTSGSSATEAGSLDNKSSGDGNGSTELPNKMFSFYVARKTESFIAQHVSPAGSAEPELSGSPNEVGQLQHFNDSETSHSDMLRLEVCYKNSSNC